MKAIFKRHKWLATAAALGLAYVLWRLLTGRKPFSAGHLSPADSIAYGWTVSQAGITGWLEVSPDGATSIMHDTGWAGNPYNTA